MVVVVLSSQVLYAGWIWVRGGRWSVCEGVGDGGRAGGWEDGCGLWRVLWGVAVEAIWSPAGAV